MEIDEVVAALRHVATGRPGLQLLVLHGSRARGDHHEASDWDLAHLGDPDHLGLLADVTAALGTDAVDLADLERASGLLRFQVATDGVLVHEAAPGVWDTFRLDAAIHWYDVEPVVRAAHADLLAKLP